MAAQAVNAANPLKILQEGYKDQKEAFVSGLVGGSITEINYVTAVGTASIFLWMVLQSKLGIFYFDNALVGVIDFLLICCSILYSTTLMADYVTALLGLIVAPAFLIPVLGIVSSYTNPDQPNLKTRKPASANQAKAKDLDPLPIKPFITAYRGWMMLITCISILAVDFPVFPRRFAKVETWGASLMDLGVGSFVFSNGVVSARGALKQKGFEGLGTRLKASARHSLPLLALGFVRLASVKGVDYAEHVTEYGVHWNFFFTLAFIPPLVALFDALFTYMPSYSLFATVVALLYQTALDTFDLVPYILTAPRVDFLSMNREGVFSLFGYLAIFLAGQGAGTYMLPRYDNKHKMPWHPLFLNLLKWSAVWTGLFFLVADYRAGAGVSISRRLANMPYVFWVAAFNTVQLTALAAMELWLFPALYTGPDNEAERRMAGNACSRVLRAFNRNGLAVFLAANLLTGLVNLTVPTIHMDNLPAMGILITYVGVLAGLAIGLDHYDISIKL